MADQTAQILQLAKDSAVALQDLLTSEQSQDTQLDTLIQLAEDIKAGEASGADQTETVNRLTDFIAALKTAGDASKAQTAKVQAAVTALQAPVVVPPATTDKSYTAQTGETIVVSQAGATPAAGEAATVNGVALTAGATFTLSDGAVLVIGDDSKVVSYTAAPQA